MPARDNNSRIALITGVSGPVVYARSNSPMRLNEAVYVGPMNLLAEIVRLDGTELVAQVYEETSGLRPGDWLTGSGRPLSVMLGPGILGGIYDGLLRPLWNKGNYISRGKSAEPPRHYRFDPLVSQGEKITGGERIGIVYSEGGIKQFTLAPPFFGGTVTAIVSGGEYHEDECLCQLADSTGRIAEINLVQPWPVRSPRPFALRLPASAPMITGQRLIDTFYPVARGGRAGMPGGFGTGKTILQQTIAKWCDADIIIYVGCGERGNEMTEVLKEFPELEDPRTGRKLIDRSVIIANTSDMPVAAREASIYTGVTVAEYFRDQGFDVALMADSTSRWAEALREISGRLGELPAEAGYPAYIGSRKAEFYERAGVVKNLAGDTGSVTIISAVSPAGGDFSEPVTRYTEQNVSCYWPLDRERARARFYPAINPLQAYSEDVGTVSQWWRKKFYPDYDQHRSDLITLLQDQAYLERMARIVGKDALPPEQQLTLFFAELVDEGLLRQNAYSPKDAFCTPERQAAMMQVIVSFIQAARRALSGGIAIETLRDLPVCRQIKRMGEEIGDNEIEQLRQLGKSLNAIFETLHEEQVT